MALKKAHPNKAQTGGTYADAYHMVVRSELETIPGQPVQGAVVVYVYADQATRTAADSDNTLQPVDAQRYDIPAAVVEKLKTDDPAGKNNVARIYAWLKTQDDYTDAVDV